MSNKVIVSCALIAALYLCSVVASAVKTDCQVVDKKPTPQVGKFNFKSCILMQFAGFLQIGENKYIEVKDGSVDTANSVCEDTTKGTKPQLSVDFACGTVTFALDQTKDKDNKVKTFVSNLKGDYQVDKKTSTFTQSAELFPTTEENHYFKCDAEQNITVSEDKTVSFIVSNLALEAYRDVAKTDFYKDAELCALDQSSSKMLGIVIGVVLVAVVAVALFAYLNQRKSY